MKLCNFGALTEALADPETARIVILPVSYDATVTFKKGTSKGPKAIIAASSELEYYDEETDYEVAIERKNGFWNKISREFGVKTFFALSARRMCFFLQSLSIKNDGFILIYQYSIF